MKAKQKVVTCVLVTSLVLSGVIGGTLPGHIGVDVVSAASGETPATAPAQTTKPSTPVAPTTSTGVPNITIGTRLMAEGSYGADVMAVQAKLNENGFKLKVDGIYGPKTLAAVQSFQSKNGLKADGIVGPKTLAKLNPTAVSEKTALKVGRAEYAAHGTKCFTVAVVAMAGDKIVAASTDDYQFMSTDVAVGVPNSDKDFGANYKDPKVVLASKRTNTAYYSEHMKEEAGSTVAIDKNYDAIQAYVVGKTVAELEATLAAKTAEQMVDAVSGATAVDTKGYVTAIVNAAKAAQASEAVEVNTADLKDIKVGRAEAAAHGTKCFTVAVAFVSNGKILAASTDDYQFMSTDVAVGVPNSDKDFGANYKDPKVVLASKRTNTAYYSEHMKEEAGSTVAIDKNYDAIQKFTAGKTVAELEATLAAKTAEQMVDAVSGATAVDAKGYVTAIVNAAKAAK